ncbi:hypothetical protein [Haladaptatus caseinilyticus]|uniref:hypothetical protein n=1 Tax=Haladaptatus caseinilyticus TaxID=2993314 RepID=UPI00224A560C|nr:hypothetical protein [Haladaptatus caseinilyticus]
MSDSPGAEVLDQMASGRDVFGRWDMNELVRAIYPALGILVLTPFLPKRLQIAGILLTLAALAGAGVVLAVEPEYLTAGEFVAQRTKWLTRQSVKLHSRQNRR